VRQRHDVVPALREASEQKYAAAQRRGVRNPNAPSPAELQHPAFWPLRGAPSSGR